jgi:VanZ family protein
MFDHHNAELIINIFNYLLLKIIKIVYFKSTRRDKLNNISLLIFTCTLVEKYGQSRSYE